MTGKMNNRNRLQKLKKHGNFTFRTQHCIECGIELNHYNVQVKRCQFCSLRHQSGKNNPNYKNGVWLRKHFCINCDKELKNPYAKRCPSCEMKRRLQLGIINNKGKNSHMWKDGASLEIYDSSFNRRLKESIRRRDNYQCQNCGVNQKNLKIKLHVHHIDHNKKNSKKNNLISLCHRCHMKTNYLRDKKWKTKK